MSFWRLYYHLVWATKNREPLIQPNMEARLYGYLVGKAAELEVFVYAVNSCADHIHMIVSIPPKQAVADVVKHLKGASSHDLNAGHAGVGVFAWQRGYGALTFGERQLPEARAYDEKQKEHHLQQSTNAWLERDSDLDEGPPDHGLSLGPVPGIARESSEIYQASGETPF